MTYETLDLIERARRRLSDRESTSMTVSGKGATEPQIAAAEETLECAFPPSYREFLRRYGSVALPPRLSTIASFVGLGAGGGTVAERTLSARAENRLSSNLVIVGVGAEPGEWYCLDTARPRADGECPVMLFDARDNQLDQQFYDDFGQMVSEVMSFVLETLEEGISSDGADAVDDDRVVARI